MGIVIRISYSVNALLILLLRGGTEPGGTAEGVKYGGCMCCRHLRRLGKGKARFVFSAGGQSGHLVLILGVSKQFDYRMWESSMEFSDPFSCELRLSGDEKRVVMRGCL